MWLKQGLAWYVHRYKHINTEPERYTMTDQLTFTTTLDADTNECLDYSVTGVLTVEGEQVNIGLTSATIDDMFNEISYWMSNAAPFTVTYKTVHFN